MKSPRRVAICNRGLGHGRPLDLNPSSATSQEAFYSSVAYIGKREVKHTTFQNSSEALHIGQTECCRQGDRLLKDVDCLPFFVWMPVDMRAFRGDAMFLFVCFYRGISYSQGLQGDKQFLSCLCLLRGQIKTFVFASLTHTVPKAYEFWRQKVPC